MFLTNHVLHNNIIINEPVGGKKGAWGTKWGNKSKINEMK